MRVLFGTTYISTVAVKSNPQAREILARVLEKMIARIRAGADEGMVFDDHGEVAGRFHIE